MIYFSLFVAILDREAVCFAVHKDLSLHVETCMNVELSLSKLSSLESTSTVVSSRRPAIKFTRESQILQTSFRQGDRQV